MKRKRLWIFVLLSTTILLGFALLIKRQGNVKTGKPLSRKYLPILLHHRSIKPNDSCQVEITRPTVTNFTRLKIIANQFVPHEFDDDSKDFCWHSHLDLSSLPRMHQLVNSYSHYEMTVSDIYRKIKKVTSPQNPLNITCLPSTHIIGFPKCGSTYLYDVLSKHPELRPAKEKEPHFWTKFPLENQVYDTYSFLTYLANFRGKDAPIPPGIRKRVSVLDASESTIWDTQRLDDLCAVPRFLRHLTPKAKFIVLLRNPVDQLYSDFWHLTLKCDATVLENVKKKIIRKVFLSIVKQELKQLDDCTTDKSIGECIHNNFLMTGNAFKGCRKIRLGINIYVVFIKRWLKFFTREQFLFIRLEDLSDNPYKVFTNVWKFLGVKVLKEEQLGEIVSATPRVLSNYPQITQKAKLTLEKFYAPFNAELANLLNDTAFLWK